jgi:hypothetical protein
VHGGYMGQTPGMGGMGGMEGMGGMGRMGVSANTSIRSPCYPFA